MPNEATHLPTKSGFAFKASGGTVAADLPEFGPSTASTDHTSLMQLRPMDAACIEGSVGNIPSGGRGGGGRGNARVVSTAVHHILAKCCFHCRHTCLFGCQSNLTHLLSDERAVLSPQPRRHIPGDNLCKGQQSQRICCSC